MVSEPFTDSEAMIAALGRPLPPAAARIRRAGNRASAQPIRPPAVFQSTSTVPTGGNRPAVARHTGPLWVRSRIASTMSRMKSLAGSHRPGQPRRAGRGGRRPPVPPRSCPRDRGGRGCCGDPARQHRHAAGPGAGPGWTSQSAAGRTARKAPGIAAGFDTQAITRGLLLFTSATRRARQKIQYVSADGFSLLEWFRSLGSRWTGRGLAARPRSGGAAGRWMRSGRRCRGRCRR